MTKKKRFIAGLLAVVICFAMLFSVCFIIAEAHHDCTGENCIICSQIYVCINTLKITVPTLTAIVLLLLSIYYLFRESKDYLRIFFDSSLVSLKVKLSN